MPRGIRTRPHFSICNQNGYSSFAVACLPHLIAQRASEDIDGGVLTIRRHRLFQIICASVCVCVCVCVRVLMRFSDGRSALPLFIFHTKSFLASIRLSNFEFLKDPEGSYTRTNNLGPRNVPATRLPSCPAVS